MSAAWRAEDDGAAPPPLLAPESACVVGSSDDARRPRRRRVRGGLVEDDEAEAPLEAEDDIAEVGFRAAAQARDRPDAMAQEQFVELAAPPGFEPALDAVVLSQQVPVDRRDDREVGERHREVPSVEADGEADGLEAKGMHGDGAAVVARRQLGRDGDGEEDGAERAGRHVEPREREERVGQPSRALGDGVGPWLGPQLGGDVG